MGTAGRLTHHVLVSRRRTHRRSRPTLRRAHHWPTSQQDAGASQLEIASRFLIPLPEAHLLPGLTQHAGAANQTGMVIDSVTTDVTHQPSVLDMPLATLSWRDPFHWLALGWQDFSRAKVIGLFYGACFVVMGWLLLACFKQAPEYTLALSAGFLLMGPFLCLGLYEASRKIAMGQPPSFWSSLTAWRVSRGQLAIFAGVLLVLEMLWGRAALIVFAVSFDGMPDFNAPLATFFTDEMLTFLITYLLVGALFAGLIFAISAVSMPMMMDMSVDAISAGLTSLRLVTTQPGVMLLWGALITWLITLAMLPGFLGLLVAGPVVGHASWHAYRAAVKQSGQ